MEPHVRPDSILYLSVLTAHIVSVIAWMAGILYLLRLFVYHAEEQHSEVRARFQVMEERLYRIITLPAMLATLCFGLVLIFLNPRFLQAGWLHTKLLLVFSLMGFTYWAGNEIDGLQLGKGRTSRTYRFLNELPTVLMMAIVALVVFKGF